MKNSMCPERHSNESSKIGNEVIFPTYKYTENIPPRK